MILNNKKMVYIS